MSEIIYRVKEREIAHIVKSDKRYYYIDSAFTKDMGYETMAFSCNKKGEV